MVKKAFFTFVRLVFLIFLLSLLVAYFVKDWVVKNALEYGMTHLLDFKTDIGELEFDFPSEIIMKHVVIYDPPSFREPVFAVSPEVRVRMDWVALLTGEKIHFRSLYLNLEEIHIEKRPDGVSNVSLLKSIRSPLKTPAPGSTEGVRRRIPFYLDYLQLHLERVTWEDRTGVLPKRLSTRVNMTRVYRHFTEFHALINLIVVEILHESNLLSLAGISPVIMERTFRSAAYKGRSFLENTKGAVERGAESVLFRARDLTPVGISEKTAAILKPVQEATTETGAELGAVIDKIKEKVEVELSPSPKPNSSASPSAA